MGISAGGERRQFVVVGTGNFGAWWVVGLLRQSHPTRVFCLDPNPQTRDVLKSRLARVPERLAGNSEVVFVDEASHLPASSNAVIIATNADRRQEAFEQVRSVHAACQWILEKPLAQSVEALSSLAEASLHLDMFVNHSRPQQPASQILQSVLDRFGLPRSVRLRGGKFELANNASHFIHLAQSLLRLEFRGIMSVELSDHWHPSRTRPGFLDVRGVLTAELSRGVRVILDWAEGNGDGAEWSFDFGSDIVRYCEISGEVRVGNHLVAVVPLVRFSDFLPQLMQRSQADTPIAGLPRLSDVLPMHLALTRAFGDHYGLSLGGINTHVPYG